MCLGTAASAITIDFSSLTTAPAVTTYNPAGFPDISITAFGPALLGGEQPALVKPLAPSANANRGLGVVAGPGGDEKDGGAIGVGEYLSFDLGPNYALVGFSLARNRGPDPDPVLDQRFELTANMASGVADITFKNDLSGNTDTGPQFFALSDFGAVNATGDVSVFQLIGTTETTQPDGFWVNSIEVRLIEAPAEVPLPASAALLVGAIAGGAWVSRRRKAA